jgi:hypothetical protein
MYGSIFALGGTIQNPSPPWKIFLTSKFPNSIIENINSYLSERISKKKTRKEPLEKVTTTMI